jgi:hypothetical protein
MKVNFSFNIAEADRQFCKHIGQDRFDFGVVGDLPIDSSHNHPADAPNA